MDRPTSGPRRFDAVIFDCDGVLLDTERCINGSWQQVLAEYGVELPYDEVFRQFGGFTIEDNRARARQLLGDAAGEQAFDEAGVLIRRRFEAGVPLIPEAEAVLDALGVPVAVATNAPRSELERKLRHSGLAGRFGHTVASTDVTRGKPAPDVYLRAAELLAVAPERCAVVEDSTTGILAGVAAGMTVFGFCRDVPSDQQRAAGAVHCAESLLAIGRAIESAVAD
ncbi:MAG: HAD family phosphatase [Pseudomonadota bacterium]